jgi:transcriptional regulator with XRE-family HTH domain
MEDHTVKNPITPAQCRAARGLIELTQTELAEAAGVSPETLRNFEAGRGQQTRSQVEAIRAAIKSTGIEFTGEGVRRALPPLEPEKRDYHIASPRSLRGRPVDNPERAAANRARVDGRDTPEPDHLSKEFISAVRGRKLARR